MARSPRDYVLGVSMPKKMNALQRSPLSRKLAQKFR